MIRRAPLPGIVDAPLCTGARRKPRPYEHRALLRQLRPLIAAREARQPILHVFNS
jgi:hypothetical protein